MELSAWWTAGIGRRTLNHGVHGGTRGRSWVCDLGFAILGLRSWVCDLDLQSLVFRSWSWALGCDSCFPPCSSVYPVIKAFDFDLDLSPKFLPRILRVQLSELPQQFFGL